TEKLVNGPRNVLPGNASHIGQRSNEPSRRVGRCPYPLVMGDNELARAHQSNASCLENILAHFKQWSVASYEERGSRCHTPGNVTYVGCCTIRNVASKKLADADDGIREIRV